LTEYRKKKPKLKVNQDEEPQTQKNHTRKNTREDGNTVIYEINEKSPTVGSNIELEFQNAGYIDRSFKFNDNETIRSGDVPNMGQATVA